MTLPPVTCQKSSDQGLTIIELMITLLLSSILVAGLFTMMSGQLSVYRSQDQLSGRNDDLNIAMEFLQSRVRRAGFGFATCPRGRIMQFNAAGTLIPSAYEGIRVYHSCDIINNDPDVMCIQSLNTLTESQRGIPDSLSIKAIDNPADPQHRDTPILSLQNADPMLADGSAIDTTSDQPIVSSTGRSFFGPLGGPPDRWMLMPNEFDPAKNCILLEMSTAVEQQPSPDTFLRTVDWGSGPNPAAGTTVSGTGTGYSSEDSRIMRLTGSSPTRHFAVDRTMIPMSLVTWTTDDTNDSRNPSLGATDREIIAENIEDMQIAWACYSGDDTLDEGAKDDIAAKQADDWAGNVSGDVEPDCGNQGIAAVRITLVSRSRDPDIKYVDGFIPAAEDRDKGTSDQDLAQSNDQGTYHRDILTSVMYLRNQQ